MSQETLGYVELEWTCKRCGTRNRGTTKVCSGCGSPMSEQDRFEAPVQAELIKDEALLAQAEKGPDIHCPFCGARNPAGSTKCGQCGASLEEAKAREVGQVVGAFKPGAAPEIACPYCQTLNPADALKCAKCGGVLQKPAAPAAPKPGGAPVGLGIGAAIGGIVLCLCFIIFMVLQARTTATTAVVQSVAWERTVVIEAQRPTEKQDWEDQLPKGAQKGACEKKFRRTQTEPIPGAEKVCGTPYTVDQGSGIGKVVQDCEYKVYDNWCTYTALEWTAVDKAIAQGNDLNPYWPRISLGAGEREGKRTEKYVVTFNADCHGSPCQYTPETAAEFSQFKPGSQWTLKVNTFGNVNSVEPAR